MKISNVEIEAITSAMFDMPKGTAKEALSTRPIDSRTLNSRGWEIQLLPNHGGVISLREIYATKKEATEAMLKMTPYDDATYRVYEALEIAPNGAKK